MSGLVASVTLAPRLPDHPDISNPFGLQVAGGLQVYENVLQISWILVWVGIMASIVALMVRFAHARDEPRQQLKWLVFAGSLLAALYIVAITAFFFGRDDVTLLVANVLVAIVGPLAIPLAVGIAILRHGLYDIDLIINRTLIYGVLTATLGLAYGLTALSLGALFGGGSALPASAATLVVAAAFQPLRRRVQDAVDVRFNRHKYDAARTIATFSSRLQRQVNLDALTAELESVVDQTMQPTSYVLWLRSIEPSAGEGPFDIASNDPLLTRAHAVGRAVNLSRLQIDSAASRDLQTAGVQVVVPLIGQDELVGMLCLGSRRGERAYSADDRALLTDLAVHAAPALRLAQLARRQQEEVRERERIEQELRVAQLIQQRFLPSDAPDLPGWRVATCYRPARAVGGDFFDFIPLTDGRLGIVVGDVTDKGVPAALIMATTHAILRAEAPRLIAPARVLERANELLVKETFEHMYVTCLYAVLDPLTGEMCFANAGHNLPYVRGKAGITELRAKGMPLGLLPGSSYEESSVRLRPGDNLLLYSDGLTEAHGRDREMFGSARVATLMAGPADGQALIAALLDELASYTGSAWEQEDDITLVTLTRTEAEEVLARFDVPSVAGEERVAIQRVADAVRTLGLPERTLERLKTAVGEATMNAIEHGNANRPELNVSLSVATVGRDLVVEVVDQAGGRAIPEPATPDLDAKLAGEQSPRGWGLFLIKNMVDELRTSSDEHHHTVELVVHLDAATAGETSVSASREA
jgi:serine phosphatase RsbU (regulator of sigma subunit)/anti-sigma regulatory factor (Ser/Thr protein kinase)